MAVGRLVVLTLLVNKDYKLTMNDQQLMDKQYIGDGVYLSVWYSPYSFILTAENGIEVTNTIYLEPEVAEKLVAVLLKQGVRV